jgi:regulatory protein
MPVITALEKQPRRQRANVFLDGDFAFSLRLDVITMARLAVGLDLDTKRRSELEAEDQRLGAVESALKLLAMGPRSEHDLRDRLKNRRKFPEDAVDHAVRRMRELGYLNDAVFARYYVEGRQASPRSKRALIFELQRKGIDKRHVETALEEHSDADAAYGAAQRRLRALHEADRQTFERRLGSFLASRGFGYGIARTTITRCWRELHGDGFDGGSFAEG